jgi:hypothetical protein
MHRGAVLPTDQAGDGGDVARLDQGGSGAALVAI